MINKTTINKLNYKKSEEEINIDESYKVIRANTMFSIIKSNCKKIVISSSNAGEGKSTTAVNLAKSLSTAGLKVLLIDTDFRKPTIKKKLRLHNKYGLTDFLINNEKNELKTIINKLDSFDNLSIITAGSSVPNPSDILASQEMSDFLTSFNDDFDYIILDAPPVNIVSDALYMAKISDGVILIVKENQTTHPELTKAINSLELIDIKILGLILNGSKKSSKYHYSSYNYK